MNMKKEEEKDFDKKRKNWTLTKKHGKRRRKHPIVIKSLKS